MSKVRRTVVRLSCRLAVVLVLGTAVSAFAAEPSELEAELTIAIDGSEKTLTLPEAMAALNIPSVSVALIDQDHIAFARGYGAGVTPETLFQAASLSKFVAAIAAMRLVDQGKLKLDENVNGQLTSWKVPANGFDQDSPGHLARLAQHDGRDRRARFPRLRARRAAAESDAKFSMGRRPPTRRRSR